MDKHNRIKFCLKLYQMARPVLLKYFGIIGKEDTTVNTTNLPATTLRIKTF